MLRATTRASATTHHPATMLRQHPVALAALATLLAPDPGLTQTTAAQPQRVEVTGTLIKRADRETVSAVVAVSRDDIKTSGYTSIEELLRSTGLVDFSSVSDGAASGAVSGISTISLRGFGSQGTLTLVNGRRIAPVAAVDVTFGRATLFNVNAIPRAAVDRVEILKDGASALYGSDAMAGVVNYVLRKNFSGVQTEASNGANDRGVGAQHRGSVAFGFGDIDTQRFNVFGALEIARRDPVMFSDIKDRGDQAGHDRIRALNDTFHRFYPDSAVSFWANYYRVPTSLTGSTTLDGISVANNDLSGANYLGTLPGCPDELTVGKGVPTRPQGLGSSAASLRNGACRFNLDNADETIARQERVSGLLHAGFALAPELQLYADLMVWRVKTSEQGNPVALTPNLVTQAGAEFAAIWANRDGTLRNQRAFILPVGHPDNPTRQPIQLMYRFEDLYGFKDTTIDTTRVAIGLEGRIGAWDIDSAFLHSRSQGREVDQARMRSFLLTSSITPGNPNYGVYRFGGNNDEAAKASVSGRPVIEGDSTLTSVDLRASRELWKMGGGNAALALGTEWRRELLASTPDAVLLSGDYVFGGGNSASGSRNSRAAFAELSLPVWKSLELQAALRGEKYSDFGNATTGKLGFKWSPIKSVVAVRGTVATGFRAPSIPQIRESYVASFHSTTDRRSFDLLRCDLARNRTIGSPNINPNNTRDCNVLAFGSAPAPERSTALATAISANPELKPERSQSATLGLLLSPTSSVDVALDFWYFHRKDEIRVQQGLDIMDEASLSPTRTHPQVIRDPNQVNWLRDGNGVIIPNSGPILMLIRGYDNYEWTRTAGMDYDLNWRFPDIRFGRFRFNVNGTFTERFDRKLTAGADVEHLVGTQTTGIPVTRARFTLHWSGGAWRAWIRHNHADPMMSTVCSAFNAATAALVEANGRCRVAAERTVDIGGSWVGVKGLALSASLLNVANDYNRSFSWPAAFNFWDKGREVALGRRFQLTASYGF